MRFTHRDATEADLPAIVAIYNESIPAGRSTADTRPVTVEERQDWFRKHDPARRPLWVALDETGDIVGWVGLSSFYGGRPAYDATAEISLYIANRAQRQGLGRWLKQEMITACPRLGVTTLLSMYFDHNEATAKLNAELGFETVGHLENIAMLGGVSRGLKIAALRMAGKNENGGHGPL